MSYLRLNPDQISLIQKKISSFAEEDVYYHGSVSFCKEPDKNWSVTIEWLEILILDQWFTLYDLEKPLKGAIFSLDEKQHTDVKVELANKHYD
jgi:hypothetical protein